MWDRSVTVGDIVVRLGRSSVYYAPLGLGSNDYSRVEYGDIFLVVATDRKSKMIDNTVTLVKIFGEQCNPFKVIPGVCASDWCTINR